MTIRPAFPDDMAAVNEIRNYFVRTSTAIYTEQETTLEERLEWLRDRDPVLHPVMVAEEDGKVVGWASLSPYSEKCGYRTTVEVSIYVMPEHQGHGVGKAMMADLMERARVAGAHCVIARIDSNGGPSIRLHESFGFMEAGRLREAGRKFGRWLTVIYMQKLL